MIFSDAGLLSSGGLTPAELLAISQEVSLKFSPNTATPSLCGALPEVLRRQPIGDGSADRDLSAKRPLGSCLTFKELHAISEEISQLYAPKVSAAAPELFLLPVDPHHLYAYWHPGEAPSATVANKGAEDHLTLRIYWRPNADAGFKSSSVWFDMAADHSGFRQKIRLPIDGSAYCAAVGTLNPNHGFDAIVASNAIQVPPASESVGTWAQPRNQEDAQVCLDYNTASESTQQASPRAFFSDQGWRAKLHFPVPPACHGGPFIFDPELMTLFKSKGISVELVPAANFSEPARACAHNASGKGI